MKTPCKNTLCPQNESGFCWFKRINDVETCKRLIAYNNGTYKRKRYLTELEKKELDKPE